MKRVLLVLTVALLVVAPLLHNSPALAQSSDCAGSGTVGQSGADCNAGSGSNSGTSGNNGSNGGGTGSGGSSSSNGNGNSGNDNGNGGSGSSNDNGTPCTPGVDIVQGTVTIPITSDSVSGQSTVTLPSGGIVTGGSIPADMCTTATGMVDACTGEAVGPVGIDSDDEGNITAFSCNGDSTTVQQPCDQFVVSGGGVVCVSDLVNGNNGSGGSSWEVKAHADWPGTEIHTRPYPATLVDWDTVMRVVGIGSSSGSGRLAYAAWGGGNSSSPASGDWKDVVLRLDIKPVTNWADVYLQNIGIIRMPIGQLHTFQWHLPSHPAAGGGPLAGQVGQLEELPPDSPLFSNWTRAPFMVYCTLEYYKWESACVSGPDANGSTNCRKDANGNYTGHREWGWKHHSQTEPIPPTAVHVQVPGNMKADLNGDGTPDAYWGFISFIRRMDDAGSVDNPDWEHSYSWGTWWYWYVREAQGQVGWPGVNP